MVTNTFQLQFKTSTARGVHLFQTTSGGQQDQLVSGAARAVSFGFAEKCPKKSGEISAHSAAGGPKTCRKHVGNDKTSNCWMFFYCASLHNTWQNQGALPESEEIIRFVIWSLLLQRSARISMQLLKNIGSGFHAVDFACFHLFSGQLMTQPDTFPPLKSEIKQSHPLNPKATPRSTAFL